MTIKSATLHTLTIAAFIFLMGSCQKDSLNGIVSGTITAYVPETPDIKTPLKGIKVYLVNTDFKIDSMDYANNAAAVVDYATTNASGKYRIAGIPEGHYAIVPVPDHVMHRFSPAEGGNSYRFAVSADSLEKTVDFTAPQHTNTDEGYHIRITVINRFNGGSLTFERPIFIFNIVPTFNLQKIDGSTRFPYDDFTLDLQYGIIGSLSVVGNNLRVQALDAYGKPSFLCWVEYNYFDTPVNSHWELDWEAERITRLE